MDAQGGAESGYEQVRKPRSAEDDFEVSFTLGSEEHKSWVAFNKSG